MGVCSSNTKALKAKRKNKNGKNPPEPESILKNPSSDKNVKINSLNTGSGQNGYTNGQGTGALNGPITPSTNKDRGFNSNQETKQNTKAMNSPANEPPLSSHISDFYSKEKQETKYLIKKLSITNVNNNIVMDPDQLKVIVENSENQTFIMDQELKKLSQKFQSNSLKEEFDLNLDPIMIDVNGIAEISAKKLTEIAHQ